MKNGVDNTSPSGVSVIIPTLNRPEILLDTIRDLLKQDFDDWELIIVDQSAEINGKALELLRENKVPARYYHAHFRGLPQARNYGWRNSLKGLVLYVDDDIRCAGDLVRAHWNAHRPPGIMLVAGGIDEAGIPVSAKQPGSFNWWTATPSANFGTSKEGRCLHVKGCNFSVNRKLLNQSSGFDEYLTVGAALYEELEFALRVREVGEGTWFAPSARLTHLAAPAGGCRVKNDWPRYMFGLSHNRAVLIFRHLRWWHRPTALLRLLLLGVSYSRLDRTLQPIKATLRGLVAGRRVAMQPPLNEDLRAVECTIS